jgi:hypothetical protein
MHAYRSTYFQHSHSLQHRCHYKSKITQNNRFHYISLKLKPHIQTSNHWASLPPVVPLLPLSLALRLPLPLVVDCLLPPIELVFSVSFVVPLTLALGKNNTNKLLRIKFQKRNFVAKSEFNWNMSVTWLFVYV